MLFVSVSKAQGCIPVAIVFSTQAQVDSFPSDYPGCTLITGSVGITGSVTHLDSLQQITQIGGGVQILNAQLTSLQGLHNVISIGGSVNISYSTISSMPGMASLISIGGGLNIQNCTLPTLELFGEISNLGGDLTIISTLGISNFEAFNKIGIINGDFNFGGPNNNSTISFTGLENLSKINGGLYIGVGVDNVDVSSLNGLTFVKSGLSLRGNISNFPAFNNLTSIGEILSISDNNSITYLNGFNSLDTLRRISIENCGLLIVVDGFDNLSHLGDINISRNPFLTSIVGLNRIIEPVYGIDYYDVNINNNPFLSSCAIDPICNYIWTNKVVSIFNNGPNCNSAEEVRQQCGSPPDSDSDGINDFADNCPNVSNALQTDCNQNQTGDACEAGDIDNDSIANATDNCPCESNPSQADANANGIGDKCDYNSDTDGDGQYDPYDNCPLLTNSNQYDCNSDGVGDVCDQGDFDNDGIPTLNDNCPCESNPSQADANANGVGNKCDYNSDSDGDGYVDGYDRCPEISTPGENGDWNNDGIGDACQDSDNDGLADAADNCRETANATQEDQDNDGIGDTCDNCLSAANSNQDNPDGDAYGTACDNCPGVANDQTDTDSDGIGDACDNCPTVANASQEDCNNNGLGDVCDTIDSDCDGIPNTSDNCPDYPNASQVDLNQNGIGDACETGKRFGINTTSPQSEVHVSDGSIYIDNPGKGIIMKGEDGKCYKITIQNTALKLLVVPCPESNQNR
jgi:hypothetical protein